MRKGLRIVFVLLMAFSELAHGQTTTTIKPPSGQTPSIQQPPKLEFGKITIEQARKELVKVQGTASMPAYLEAYALALPLDSALILYREYFSKLLQAQKEMAAKTAVALSLLAGHLDDALIFLPALTSVDARIIEIRLFLAAGKLQEAQTSLKQLRDTQQSKKLAYSAYKEAEIKLLEAWLAYFEGFMEQSFSFAKSLAASEIDKNIRSETYLLLWYIANSEAFTVMQSKKSGFDAKSMTALMSKELPQSVEYGIITGTLKIAPSAWLLESTRVSGLVPSPLPVYATQAEKISSSGISVKEGESAASSSFSRLQAGWFSVRENAVSFQTTLVKKGFKAIVEEQKNKDGELRWAVIVDAEGDWSQMQARLKDAGFESYLVQ